MALVALSSLGFPDRAPEGHMNVTPEKANPNNHMHRAAGGAFISPSYPLVAARRLTRYRKCEITRQLTVPSEGCHHRGTVAGRAKNKPPDCGARPDRSVAARAIALRSGCKMCDRVPPWDASSGGTKKI